MWASDEEPVWPYEASPLTPNSKLLVSVIIGKIESISQLQSIFKRPLFLPEVKGRNGMKWAKEALDAVMQDPFALGTSINDWEAIRSKILFYAAMKIAVDKCGEQSTWDMLENRAVMY